MLSAFFRLVGRHFWPVTTAVAVATGVATWLGDYQAMALLGSTFGGLLMWQAERSPVAA